MEPLENYPPHVYRFALDLRAKLDHLVVWGQSYPSATYKETQEKVWSVGSDVLIDFMEFISTSAARSRAEGRSERDA